MKETIAYLMMALKKDFSEFSQKKLQEMGLSRGLLYFILYIGKHPNCSPGSLSTALQYDTGHTTRSIEKLVQMGFVLREKNECDKRAFKLNLTEKGEAAFKKSYDLFEEWDEGRALSLEERGQLKQLLNQVLKQKRD